MTFSTFKQARLYCTMLSVVYSISMVAGGIRIEGLLI